VYASGDGFLHRYFLNNGGKRLHKWLHYFDIYERHLSRFRGRSPVMLEVGVFGGGSLAMWRDYLGPGSQIVGLDINPTCKAKYPQIDIVLDDGSYVMQHMIATFQHL
jgi:hypothetical protein